ncbi:MAG: hypothetical protein ACOY0T_35140 [Myxococcota bacterium]
MASERNTDSNSDIAIDADFDGIDEVMKALTEAHTALPEPPDELSDCDQEIAHTTALFERFWSEKVALAVLPLEARELLGPIQRWRWCFEHVRCCFVFGYLLCRAPQDFRGFSVYLKRYWFCVRQLLGAPVHQPLLAEEREDFTRLVRALSEAYRPALADDLAHVEAFAEVAAAVLDDRIDCHVAARRPCALFERVLTFDTAHALLGREAFEKHQQEPFFWFCRCLCLCALCFGCCLARARTLKQRLRCLREFHACLRHCFRPLSCGIDAPVNGSCAEEQAIASIPLLGVEIVGTAAGAGCVSYVLEWKAPLDPPAAFTQAGIVYAGSPGPGTCGKVNTTLGWLDTFSTPLPNEIEIRLRVFGQGNQVCEATTRFQLFRKRVWISALEGVQVESPPGFADPNARLIDPVTTQELSFGTALQVMGHALVGKCFGRDIKRYTLHYQPGFVTDPLIGSWTQFWQVDYSSPLQRAAIQTSNFDLTSFWVLQQVCFFPPCPPFPTFNYDELIPTRWQSHAPGQFFPVDPELPPIWGAQSLPPINCHSGRYTLRLDVEDTLGNHYYDLQRVWFDNKPVTGEITGLQGVPACAVVNLSQLLNAGNCSVAWPLTIDGIAYDEFIIEGDTTVPSDNYGGYCVTLTKQGGSQSGCSPIALSVPLPVPAPASPTTIGLNRVGDPGTRCPTAAPPPALVPPKTSNALTVMDARMFDAVCASSAQPIPPAGFALERGECCAYYFVLRVWDRSICPSLSGGHHEASFTWPVYVCNDLPPL